MAPPVSSWLLLSWAARLALEGDALSASEVSLFQSPGCAIGHVGTCSNTTGIVGSVAASISGSDVTLSFNSVPDHQACAPGSSRSGALCYDNGEIYEVVGALTVPKTPTKAASTTCTGSRVGIARNGVEIFSAFAPDCSDALWNEGDDFDACWGHPDASGAYHYHGIPGCLPGLELAMWSGSEYFVGVAVDGFPIYGPWDGSGGWLDNSRLDSCHGYDSPSGYRYILNDEFPYVVGCFVGTPVGGAQCMCSSGTGPDEPAAGTGAPWQLPDSNSTGRRGGGGTGNRENGRGGAGGTGNRQDVGGRRDGTGGNGTDNRQNGGIRLCQGEGDRNCCGDGSCRRRETAESCPQDCGRRLGHGGSAGQHHRRLSCTDAPGGAVDCPAASFAGVTPTNWGSMVRRFSGVGGPGENAADAGVVGAQVSTVVTVGFASIAAAACALPH